MRVRITIEYDSEPESLERELEDFRKGDFDVQDLIELGEEIGLILKIEELT